MRGKNIVKLFRAIDLIARTQGATIKELSERLEIDPRSVHRTLNVMEEMGIPLYDDKNAFEKEKRWKIEDRYLLKLPNLKMPNLTLTLSEIIALYLIKGHEKIYKNTDIEKKVDSAFAKIDAFAPTGLSDKIQKIRTLFTSTTKFAKDYSGKEELIDNLTDTMLNKTTCLIKYHSFGDDKIKEFEIDPLSFFDNDGGLYIFANSTKYFDVRVLAVERIQDLTPTKKHFDYPKDFAPEELLDSAFNIIYDDPIEVSIWFSAGQGRYIKERTWAKGQKITDHDDGSIILEMKTSGMWEIKRWVLSFGADAKVLAPDKLKAEIVNELHLTKDNYSTQ